MATIINANSKEGDKLLSFSPIVDSFQNGTFLGDTAAEFIKRFAVRTAINAIQNGNLNSVMEENYIDLAITSMAVAATKDKLKLPMTKEFEWARIYVDFIMNMVSQSLGVMIIRIILNTLKLFENDTYIMQIFLENFLVNVVALLYKFLKDKVYVPSNGNVKLM